MKYCPKCGRDLAIDAFALRKKGGVRRQSYCNECVLAVKRLRRQKPELKAHIRAKDREYNSAKLEIPGARERAISKSQAWRDQNPERHKAQTQDWYRRNPEAYRVHSARARAVAWGVENTLTIAEWVELLAEHERRCWYCGDPYGSIDHVVPMSKGGPNTRENVVPACLRCNCSKSDGESPKT